MVLKELRKYSAADVAPISKTNRDRLALVLLVVLVAVHRALLAVLLGGDTA